MYSLVGYGNNYLKTFGSLWQCYRDKQAAILMVILMAAILIMMMVILLILMQLILLIRLISKKKTISKTEQKSWNVSNLILTWFASCFIVSTTIANEGATFATTDTKLDVAVVTSSSQDIVKLLDRLKWGFKRTPNWNKYQWKVSIERKNVIGPTFQTVYRLWLIAGYFCLFAWFWSTSIKWRERERIKRKDVYLKYYYKMTANKCK